MTVIPFPDMQQGCGCKAPQWISLPVAPQAFARTRLQGDGKLPQAVSIQGAFSWINDKLSQNDNIAGLDIYGPGDPLATQPITLEILTVLREEFPELPLGLTTLGIDLAGHVKWLTETGVARVTLLVDAIDPLTLQKIYAWIRPGKKNIPLAKGAELLVDEQVRAIEACNSSGITVSIRTTVYAGINEEEVGEIAHRFSSLGAESITLVPGKGLLDGKEEIPQPSIETMEDLAEKAGKYMKAVHVQIPQDKGDIIPLSLTDAMTLPKPTTERPNVAVLSSNGMDIDLHLGQAIKALVYGPREDGLACLLEARDLPEPGSGDKRWFKVAGILDDCFGLLAASAGQKPREFLGRHGLPILLMEDNVEGTVDALYGGGKKGKR